MPVSLDFVDGMLKVPGPISEDEFIYSNDTSSPKISWFQISAKLVTRRDYIFCNCLYLTV